MLHLVTALLGGLLLGWGAVFMAAIDHKYDCLAFKQTSLNYDQSSTHRSLEDSSVQILVRAVRESHHMKFQISVLFQWEI